MIETSILFLCRKICVRVVEKEKFSSSLKKVTQENTKTNIIDLKMALHCPQGSGTLRQQLFMMHGVAWYCMVLQRVALYCMVLHYLALIPDICYGSHGNTCVNFFWPV